ncbi:MAG: DUF4440 domain-containing protein [Nitrospiraceae bacterium]|nr:DUF4440 domain-containing protein [Nitrospiraceae bacterium]
MFHSLRVLRGLRSSLCYLIPAVILVLAIGATGWAEEKRALPLGEQLVRQFWEAIRTHDVVALDAILAPGFQSIHQDGPRDKKGELALCAGLDIDKYTLTDFVTTRQGATIVVTFMASVEEMLAGVRTTTVPAARMAVFLMTEEGWRLITYANLKPIGD